MPDDSSDKPSVTPPIPNKPPKPPRRDYSALPQKPITLKHKAKKATHKSSKSPAKSASATSKKKPSSPWNIDSMSTEAKQIIQAGAESQGLTIAQWLEALVMNQDKFFHHENEEREKHLLRSLHDIEQRLDRIEQQRGFWSRFWDQVMNQGDADKS
jgi:uncharacterized protein (DUF1501 family)